MSEATFSAKRLDDAMALVKRALGPDALILSSRRIDEQGGSRFEVRAAPGFTRSAVEASSEAPLSSLPLPTFDEEDGPPTRNERSMNPLERILRDNEVDADHVRELLKNAPVPRSFREVRELLLLSLRKRVGFGDRAKARVTALVGPTGVGKTTTIAKLAARDALIRGLRVALISLDDYRIGGAEQLGKFAELMEVPFELARDARGLKDALARHGSADRVYIDTAGRGPRDVRAHAELASLLGATREKTGILLTLSASTRRRELEQVIQRHEGFPLTGLVVTKLDEALYVGGSLSAALRTNLPIAWLTNGQRVPEDIEAASAELLASALIGEEVES